LDTNQMAHRIARIAAGEEVPDLSKPKRHRKNPAAVALGRKGGLKGGKARAAALTPVERSRIASKAAAARWKSDRQP
jgi:hypothetical protein